MLPCDGAVTAIFTRRKIAPEPKTAKAPQMYPGRGIGLQGMQAIKEEKSVFIQVVVEEAVNSPQFSFLHTVIVG